MCKALLPAIVMVAAAVASPVVDLLREGRYSEARQLLESSESHPRYQLLYYAMMESDVARACSLYQVIAIRYPGTDCDTVAQERLQLAQDMGFVIIPIVEWEQAPVEARMPSLRTLSRETRVTAPPVERDSLAEGAAHESDVVSESQIESEAPLLTSQPLSMVSTKDSPRVQPLPPASRPHDVPAGESGRWFIQVGAFASPDNADRLAARLRGGGYSVILVPRESPNGTLIQVRVGGYETKVECGPVADALRTVFDVPTDIIRE